MGWQRIDHVLQEGSDSGLMGHIRAVSNAHHCYWWSKDLSLFILDTILEQRLSDRRGRINSERDSVVEAERGGCPGPRGGVGETKRSDGVGSLAVKEQVLWLLTSDLLAAQVPTVAGTVSAAGGAYNYALGNLKVSEMVVPRKQVVVVEALNPKA